VSFCDKNGRGDLGMFKTGEKLERGQKNRGTFEVFLEL
jgi:hypothetical protein